MKYLKKHNNDKPERIQIDSPETAKTACISFQALQNTIFSPYIADGTFIKNQLDICF